jgi:hypothetical protein
MSISRLFSFALLLLATANFPLAAKSKKATPPPPQDQIEVLANVPVNGDSITRFTVTQHYNRDYLYAEHASQKTLTLIDITNPRHPQLLANLDMASASLLTAAGDVALVRSNAPAATTTSVQTISIMNFSDRAHPQTVRQFANVSTIKLDDRLGLIILADEKGIWILKRKLAEDPAEEERYAQYILHNN